MRMGRRILTTLRRTALHAGPTVLGIIVLDFLLLQLMPGDAADVIASESGVATAETMAALRDGDPAVSGDIGMRCEVLPLLSAIVAT